MFQISVKYLILSEISENFENLFFPDVIRNNYMGSKISKIWKGPPNHPQNNQTIRATDQERQMSDTDSFFLPPLIFMSGYGSGEDASNSHVKRDI